MGRLLIGSLLGGLLQFIIGAIAWATPLGRLAFGSADEAATAELQAALARTLAPTGTGTYFIPSPETAEGTVMLGKGPVAVVLFNSSGFPPMDPTALLTGLVMSVAMLFLTGAALSMIDGFAKRFQALLLIAAATVLYFILALPVFNIYMPWAWWIFLAVECFIGFVAGGYVLLRWFMPKEARVETAPESAPLP
jgi:hypothetical protein